ncbi:lipopolysaccharide biosynthesis protein, partial [Enterococcus faecalis]|nr:lipopolysaccharide biosynthesis protein [Enterococcus faecalis]
GINFSKITYVAAFVCAAYILNFFTSYWILMTKVLEGKLSDVLKQLISPVCISVVLAAALFLFDHLITIDTNYFVLLVIKGILWL